MKEALPARRDAGASARPETRQARRSAAPADESCPVVVRYYHRMRLQRVYSIVVELSRADRRAEAGAGGLPAVVRPVIPGALVVPAEERIDASIPGSRAVFQVTPLARRRLPDARIEVHQKSRPVQQVPLDMRVTTQRLAWLLLALAVLVPWGLTQMARSPLSGDVYDLPPTKRKDAPAPEAPKAKNANAKEVTQANEGPVPRAADRPQVELVAAPQLAEDDPARLRSEAVSALLVLLQPGQPKGGPMGGGMPKGGPMGGGMPGGAPAQASGSPVPTARPGSPDEVLRDRFRTWARTSLPDISGVSNLIASDAFGQNFHLDRQRPEGVEEGSREVVYNDLASWLSWLYRWTVTLTEDGLALYAGVMLLALAFIAWLMHRAARAYERQALVFAAPRTDAGGETLPLGEGAG